MNANKLYFLDHHDSFSYNLIDWLAAGSSHKIVYIDCADTQGLQKMKSDPCPLILSPGPGSPRDYPQSMEVLGLLSSTQPILGVCLGHQMLGEHFGASLTRAQDPFHGRAREVRFLNDSIYENIDNQTILMTSYNSLTLSFDKPICSKTLDVVAICEKGEIAAIKTKREDNILQIGWQFHPESFLSQNVNFIRDTFFNSLGSSYG